MQLYSGPSTQFVLDSAHNRIAEKLKTAFQHYFGYEPPTGELRSWQNSLRALSQIVQVEGLDDHGVMVEYQLPQTSKRLDCLITGRDDRGDDQAIIIELKQWDACEPSNIENEVVTWVGGNHRDVLHPSAQVSQYRDYLADSHTSFYEGERPVGLAACAYLHNYYRRPDDPLYAPKFQRLLESAPVYDADHSEALGKQLSSTLSGGNGLDVLQRVEEGRFRPSKKLMQHVSSVIEGNREFVLLDEQLVAFDRVMQCVESGIARRKKQVVLIKGGPGTGKSVLALNLMGKLLEREITTYHATGSKAFTGTIRKIMGTRAGAQFKYFNNFNKAEYNEIDVLICDEAHRIRENSFNRFTPRADRTDRSQLEELIAASKVTVFFLDDDQVVRPGEIGSSSYIREFARENDCEFYEFGLEAQFRCSGSEAFVNWINHTLGIKPTANPIWQGDENFDFRIMESPAAVDAAIRQKAEAGESARMVAGFCWPWSKPNPDGTLVNDIQLGDFQRPWNARGDAGRLAPGIPKSEFWAYEEGGIDQVGCIYTAQGFEFDYVGVIFGLDLRYDLDAQQWIADRSQSHDTVVKRSGDRFVDLVKNTYRVLLSRGMKGCYVCFLDRDTERWFKSRMAHPGLVGGNYVSDHRASYEIAAEPPGEYHVDRREDEQY